MKKTVVGMVALAAVVSLMATGCAGRFTVNQPSDAVVLELGAKDYRVTGHGKGKDCHSVILGMQFTAPSYAKAEEQALAESKGKYLLNKRMYDGVENDLLLFKEHCRYVEGTGVSF
ncbi:MAG: hypothetical protein KC466_03980 [Myxococcales bacterium]|nr:hypothetical protein [Myxococcales bacterium]